MIRRKSTALAAALVLLPVLASAQVPSAPAPAPLAPHQTPSGPVTLPSQLPQVTGAPLADSDRSQSTTSAQNRADYQDAQEQAADKGGMPQLDFGNPLTTAQIVWLFVIFGAFVLICYQWLLPPVGEVLANRRQRIGADLEAARAAKAQADEAGAAHQASMRQARAQAQESINAAVASANAEAAAKAEALNARLQDQIATAEARINQARDAAMGALREVATDAASALVETLSGIKDQAAVAQAVDRQIGARGKA